MDHVTLEQVLRLAEQLSSSERAALIARLQEMPEEPSPESAEKRRQEWLAFIERTAGSLADDPVERPAFTLADIQAEHERRRAAGEFDPTVTLMGKYARPDLDLSFD